MSDPTSEPTGGAPADPIPAAAQAAQDFFQRYAAALLARDEEAISTMYAVPALIVFPGQAIAVSSAEQTAGFFAASWEQYRGVTEADFEITVMGAGPAGLWADVRWSYGGGAQERFCYQLVPGGQGHQVAVLTPLSL